MSNHDHNALVSIDPDRCVLIVTREEELAVHKRSDPDPHGSVIVIWRSVGRMGARRYFVGRVFSDGSVQHVNQAGHSLRDALGMYENLLPRAEASP